jgi:hypothetical protein
MTRSLVALFAISWLGLAVQPCAAMAQGAGHQDGRMAAHHDGHGGAGHECPHCPPASADDDGCGTGTALNCESAGIPGPAAQTFEPPRFDTWAVMDLPAPRLPALSAIQPGAATSAPDIWRPPSASIQQRFCSFLK